MQHPPPISAADIERASLVADRAALLLPDLGAIYRLDQALAGAILLVEALNSPQLTDEKLSSRCATFLASALIWARRSWAVDDDTLRRINEVATEFRKKRSEDGITTCEGLCNCPGCRADRSAAAKAKRS